LSSILTWDELENPDELDDVRDSRRLARLDDPDELDDVRDKPNDDSSVTLRTVSARPYSFDMFTSFTSVCRLFKGLTFGSVLTLYCLATGAADAAGCADAISSGPLEPTLFFT